MSAAQGIARRIAAGTLHAASGRLAGVLMWLVLTPAILAALGRDGFAVWSLAFAFSGYLNALDLGLAQGTLRHVAAARGRGDPGGGGAYVTLSLLGYLLLGALWLIVALLLRAPLLEWLRVPDDVRSGAGIALVGGAFVFTFSGFANVMVSVLQAYGRFDRANRLTLTVLVAQGLGIVLSLKAGWGLPGLMTSLGIGWLAGFAAGLIALPGAAPALRWARWSEARVHLAESWRFGGPLQAAAALAVAHGQLDKILLARMVALAAVTPFELGLRVITAAASLPQMLLLAAVPTAATLQAGADLRRLRELYLRGNRYVIAVGAIVFAPCLGSADRLFATWLGPGHPDAALALRGLALSAAVSLTGSMGVTIARGVGRTDLEVWLSATSLAVHLAVSIWLIPFLGLKGALIGLLAGHVVGVALFLWRLAGALGWGRARILLEPLGLPVFAAALGVAASALADRLAPAWGGPGAWALLAVVGTTGALTTAAVIVGTRFVRIGEVWKLIRPAS
jgi:O-antigen/teichoic acid export membrane protein